MASVFCARDITNDTRVALKLLSNSGDPKHRALFEREFYVLAGLTHPNLVEVYDYGVDVQGAHYAMELLEGADLSTRALMPWQEVSRVLRDLASALALLHARRLVHRDVSHRNVWCTHTGQIKLIDFGALASFGNVSEIVGTPPFVAPEALLGQGLDQRTDLYALGALGYWLLTGVHAYPAKHLGGLTDAWALPVKAASARVREHARADLPEVPAELDALLSALLSREPAGRPVSAAEVLERVSSIAQLQSDHLPHEAGSYLSSTAFVGRSRERDQFRSALANAARGQGSLLFVEGLPGAGRTRLLAEMALDARFMRSVVLQAEAQQGGELHSFVLAVGQQLIDSLPAEARRAAAPVAPVLGHLSPKLRDRLWGEHVPLAELPQAPGEARMRMQAALLEWFMGVESEQPLVILVDDVQTLDSGSGGWLAALARECVKRKIVIVASLRDDVGSTPSYVVQALRQSATQLVVPPLTDAETLELTRCMFGDALHLRRVARLFWERSLGNPAHIAELAQHLVQQGLARYTGGTWSLPHELDEAALPSDRRQVAAAKLSRLAADERELAQVLSVSEGFFSLAHCRLLSELMPTRLFDALQALVSSGVLTGVDGGYRFVHQEVRAMLLLQLSPERCRKAHRALGQALVERGLPVTSDRLRAGLHLMLGGDVEQGSLLISQAAIRFGTVEHAETGTVGAELEHAIRLFRAEKFGEATLVPLLCAVTQAGYYGDRRLATLYGEETMEALQRTLRFETARKLRPYLGRKLSLFIAIACAAVALRVAARKSPRIPSLQDTVRFLFGSGCALAGIATICIDPFNGARYARIFEPLTALGKDHAATVLHDFCVNLSLTVQDRPELSIARWDRFIQRMESPLPIRDLPAYARVFYLGGALYARGVVECWRESPRALEIADRLEGIALRLYALSADQLRAFYSAIQGDIERYEYFRDRVEIHAIQRGTAWQVEIWAPAAMLTVHLRTRDAMRMKQCLEQLKHLYEEVPSLSLYAIRARGAYALLRGDIRQALPLLQKIWDEQPQAIVGWARQHGALAQAYNVLGEHQKAKDICARALAYLAPADLEFTAMNLSVQVELALAEAGLGNHAHAAEMLDALLQRHAEKGAVTRGTLHDARAHVAALAGDSRALTLHLGEMKRLYASTKLPSLIERDAQVCELLQPRAAHQSRPEFDRAEDIASLEILLQTFEQAAGPSVTTASEWTLRQLAMRSRADEAYLYQRLGDHVVCAAELGAAHSPEIGDWVAERLESLAASERTETALVDAAPANPDVCVLNGKQYRLTLLMTSDNDVFGAVVFPGAALPPSNEVLVGLADRLMRI